MLLNTVTQNPFVGLRPFKSDESLLFFGRNSQTAELLELLSSNHFVAVVGRSGCGKSSLIRAGLIPKLQAGFLIVDRDRWVVATMKPGDAPLRNLALAVLEATAAGGTSREEITAEDVNALAEEMTSAGVEALVRRLAPVLDAAEANFLLLADQFEEVFRFGSGARRDEDDEGEEDAETIRSRDEAAEFVSLLLALSEQTAVPTYVVMTMRSDFLGDCDIFYGLPEAMNRSQYLVPRLSTQQREEAICGPIRLCGQSIAPRLLDLVRNDVGERLDQLPVMQHAMMRTWERWREKGSGPVDVTHYREAGTIERALSDDAQEVLDAMTPEQQDLTRRLFQTLTDTDFEGRRVRRPADLGKLEAITGATRAEIMEVVGRFEGGGRSFLTVSPEKFKGNDLVDISHESLIRRWKTLREWVDREAEDRSNYLRVADDAVRHKFYHGGLWDDPELRQTLEWWDERRPTRAWAEQYHPALKSKYPPRRRPDGTLEASVLHGFDTYAEARKFLDASRAARDAERDERERQRQRQLRLTRLIALIIAGGLILSAALGLYADQQRANAEANLAEAKRQEALAVTNAQQAVTNARQAEENARVAEVAKLEAEEQRDIAARNAELADTAKRDAETQARIAKASAAEADAAKIYAQSQADSAFKNAQKAQKEQALSARLVYNGDIRTAAHASLEDDGDASVARTGLERYLDDAQRGFEWRYLWRQLRRDFANLKGHDGNVQSVASSPDGQIVATGGADNTLQLRDSATGWEARTLTGHADSILAVAFSPDGQTVATASADGTVKLWAAKDGVTAGAEGVAESGARTGVGNAPQDMSVRTLPHGRVVDGNISGLVTAVTFVPDSTLLVTGDEDGAVRVWDTAAPHSALPRVFKAHVEDVEVVAASRDGKLLATGGDGKVKVWDMDTLRSVVEFPENSEVDELGVVAKVKSLAFARVKGEPRLFARLNNLYALNVKTSGGPRVEAQVVRPNLEGSALALTDEDGDGDDDALVTGGEDGTLGLWKLTDLTNTVVSLGEKDSVPVISACFLPRKATLAAGSADGSTRLWDTRPRESRALESRVVDDGWVSRVAFSPDGEWVAAGGQEGTVSLWRASDLKELSPPPQSDMGQLSALAFSPVGKIIVSGGSGGRLNFWRADVPNADSIKLSGHQNDVSAAAFSSDGGLLATGDADGKLIVWKEASSPQPSVLKELPAHPDSSVTALAFSADGKVLASGGGDGVVRLWKTTNWESFDYPQDGNIIGSLSFPSDKRNRKLLIASGADIKIWDTERVPSEVPVEVAPTKKSPRNILPPSVVKLASGPVTAAVFSHDGRTIATGNSEGEVKLWDAVALEEDKKTGRLTARSELAKLKKSVYDLGNPFESAILGLAFSPDDLVLVGGGGDGVFRLWRGAMDKEVAAQRPETRPARRF